MDIRSFRYFVGIAEAGSILGASERLRVAQPALSVSLANLEADLGVRLMERTPRGSRLTPEGDIFYHKAKALLAQYQETVSCLAPQDDHPSSRVSVGFPSSASSILGSELYRRVRDQYPDIRLYLSDASSASVFEWLIERRIDFALLFSLPDDPRLNAVPLHDEEFYLVSRADGAGEGRDLDFERIFDRPLVLPCKSIPWRRVIDDVAARLGRILDPLIETESVNVMRSIVLAGEASCILPLSYVRTEIDSGVLMARRLVRPSFRGTVSIVNLASLQLNANHLAVQQMIVDIVRGRKDLKAGFATMSRWTETPRAVPGKVLPMGDAWRSGRILPSRIGKGIANFN